MESRCSFRGGQSSASFPIMSFGLDPAWGGMMLALWPAGEDSGASVSPGSVASVALPHIWPDAFAAAGSAASGGFTFSSGAGDWTLLQLCEMPSVYAVAFNTAKTTGWVVLLGFGSLFLYRVCRKMWPRVKAKLPSEISSKVISSPSSKRSSPPLSGNYTDLIEDFNVADDNDITGLYFGPAGMDSSTASLPLAGPVTPRTPPPPTLRPAKRGKVAGAVNQQRRRSGWDVSQQM